MKIPQVFTLIQNFTLIRNKEKDIKKASPK